MNRIQVVFIKLVTHFCAHYYICKQAKMYKVISLGNPYDDRFSTFLNERLCTLKQQNPYTANFIANTEWVILVTCMRHPGEKLSDTDWTVYPELCRFIMEQRVDTNSVSVNLVRIHANENPVL